MVDDEETKAAAAATGKMQRSRDKHRVEEEDDEVDEEEDDEEGQAGEADDEEERQRRPWAAPHFSDQQPSLAPTPLFTVNLNNSIGSEYSGLIEDVLRMVSLQFTIQVMLYFGNATERMFTEELFVLLFYIVLGVAFYWLFVRTLVTFR